MADLSGEARDEAEDDEVGPLLRDTPPPPGYVDPIAASGLLDDPSLSVGGDGRRRPQVRPVSPEA